MTKYAGKFFAVFNSGNSYVCKYLCTGADCNSRNNQTKSNKYILAATTNHASYRGRNYVLNHRFKIRILSGNTRNHINIQLHPLNITYRKFRGA